MVSRKNLFQNCIQVTSKDFVHKLTEGGGGKNRKTISIDFYNAAIPKDVGRREGGAISVRRIIKFRIFIYPLPPPIPSIFKSEKFLKFNLKKKKEKKNNSKNRANQYR